MRYEFGFGIGFDRNGQPIPAAEAARACRSVLIHASTLFGGCNLLSGHGAWIDPDGRLVIEESRVLVVDSGRGTAEGRLDALKVQELAEFIRGALNQTAVHVARLVATAENVVAIG